VNFTVQVHNAGPATAQSVVVRDVLPQGLTFISASPNVGIFSGNTWNVGDMASGETDNLQIVAKVTRTGQITNSATGSTVTAETNYGNNVGTVSLNGGNPPTGCIDVYKTAYDASGNPLSSVPPFAYSLDGFNTITSDSSGHAHFSNVSVGNHTVAEQKQTGWTMTSIFPQNGVVQVSAGSACAVVNVSNAQNASSASSASSVNNTTDISVLKNVNNASPLVGSTVTFTVTVFNAGPQQALNTKVIDILPAGLSFVSVDVDFGTFVGNTWTIGTMQPNHLITMHLTAKVNVSGALSNTATASTTTLETNYNNDDSTATLNGTPPPTGCIDVYKTALDKNGNTMLATPPFTFTVDGFTPQTTDSSGHTRFTGVSVDTHTVAEKAQPGWVQTSITPANGVITVTNSSICTAVYVTNRQSTGENSSASSASSASSQDNCQTNVCPNGGASFCPACGGGSSSSSSSASSASSARGFCCIGAFCSQGDGCTNVNCSACVAPSSSSEASSAASIAATCSGTACADGGTLSCALENASCVETSVTPTCFSCNANSSASSSSSSVSPQLGGILITNHCRDRHGHDLVDTVPALTYMLDGFIVGVNDNHGKLTIDNVKPGTYTVTEAVPDGWTLKTIDPPLGKVTVVAANALAGQAAPPSNYAKADFHNTQDPLPDSSSSAVSSSSAASTAASTAAVSSSSAASVAVISTVSSSSSSSSSVVVTCSGAACAGGGNDSCALQNASCVETSIAPTCFSCLPNPPVSSSSSSVSPLLGGINIFNHAIDRDGVVLTDNVPALTYLLDGFPVGVNDNHGKLTLDNVAPGTYTVTEAVPEGWTLKFVLPALGRITVKGVSTQTAQLTQSNPNYAEADFTNTQDPIVVLGASSSSQSSAVDCTNACQNGGNNICGFTGQDCQELTGLPCIRCVARGTAVPTPVEPTYLDAISSSSSSSRAASGYCCVNGRAVAAPSCTLSAAQATTLCSRSTTSAGTILGLKPAAPASAASSASVVPSCTGNECATKGNAFCAPLGLTCETTAGGSCFRCAGSFPSSFSQILPPLLAHSSASAVYISYAHSSAAAAHFSLASATSESPAFLQIYQATHSVPPFCGNGTLNPGEQCDDGAANADNPGARCRTDCTFARCGDGIVDVPFEQCDDGTANGVGADNCDTSCHLIHPSAQVLPAMIVPLPFLPGNVVQSSASSSSEESSAAVVPAPQPPRTPSSGPETLLIMIIGASAGYAYMRRKKIAGLVS
jgi:uncharacterized repeat protein (TIGR01451 family)